MSIEAVHDVEHFGIFGRLSGQIGCAAAAQNHHVDFADPIFDLGDVKDGDVRRLNFDFRGIATREDRHELSIGIFFDGALNAASEVAVTDYSYFHELFPPVKNYFQNRNAL